LGAQAGLIAPDATTAAFLAEAGAPEVDMAPWFTDDGAELTRHRFDAATLEPHVAAPHSPANSQGVSHYADTPIDVAYIGACTGAKLDDLRMAASVLKGRQTAANVSLLLAPASLKDQETAREEGTLGILLDAGAKLLPNACGVCAGYGGFRFGENAVVISSTARNSRGRMGAASSQVYLGSPYTVAASAVAGRICDPREFLA
ncbi:MAG: 3-isopropylmalate dehydratase, partial [Betaproteobacteria bacterium]